MLYQKRQAGSNNDVIVLLSAYMTAYQCLESVVGVEADEEAEDVESKLNVLDKREVVCLRRTC